MFLRKTFAGLVYFLLLWSQLVGADVRLPKLLSSGMVLQRDAEVQIWGWAEPGENVSVVLNKTKRTTVADRDGRWRAVLPPMEAGGPFAVRIEGNNTVELSDVLVGDVWLASGQSNMELTLARAEPRFPELIANIHNDQIRQFDVPDRYDFKKAQADVQEGQWQAATQANVRQFSALGYFFAEQIQREEQVPIGVINASLGGSPVEAWMSEEALKKFPEPYREAQRFRSDELIENVTQADQSRSTAWFEQLNQKDQGYNNDKYLWAVPEFNTEDWKTVQIPGYWSDSAVASDDGVVWFRKTVHLSKALAKQKALLILGAIVDADQVFVNGVLVGETGYMYPPRRYDIPPKVLQSGKNTITIRVISQQGRGGFVPEKEYALHFPKRTINLAGQWHFKRGAVMPTLPSATFIRWKPMGLYNAMIAPLLNYRIKGAIWYQGESNAGDADAYSERFPAMITDWRKQWQQGDFPFLFVQLANYVSPGSPRDQVGNWPELRQAQAQALMLPNTAMVVSIDAGEWNDIHPLDKKTIAQRLAAAAGHIAYGRNSVYSGPVLASAKVRKKSVVLEFNHIGSGLMAKGGVLRGFEVAGAEGEFHRADGEIRNNRVVVWAEAVAKPEVIRYAWADNPEFANLFNAEGFPASPFRVSVKQDDR